MPTSERRRHRFRFHQLQKKKGWYYGILKDTDEEKRPARKWFPLGTRKKGEAHAEYERLQHLFWIGEWSPWESAEPKTTATIGEALSEFMGHYETTVRDKTAKNMRSCLRLFQEHVGSETAARGVTADHIRSWLETPTSAPGGSPSPSTLRTYLMRLNQAFEWMVDEGILNDNPADAVDRPDASGDTFSVLSPKEMDTFVNQVAEAVAEDPQSRQTWLLDVLNFNVCAGLRLGELCALRWADVERLRVETDMATVHVQPYPEEEVEEGAEGFTPKTRGSERRVHVWPRGTYVLRRLAERSGAPAEGLVFRGGTGGPLSYQWFTMKFREHAEEAGLIRRAADDTYIRRVRPHDLRHTWISWMVNEFEHQLGVRTVADMAGHEDPAMTDQYRRSDPTSVRDAMLRAGGKRPEGGRRPSYEEVSEWLHAEPQYEPEPDRAHVS